MYDRIYEAEVRKRHDHDDHLEYSDDEDVPARDPSGAKIWDYFYIHTNDLLRGLNNVKILYRREYDILFHKFIRTSRQLGTFRAAPRMGVSYKSSKTMATTRHF